MTSDAGVLYFNKIVFIQSLKETERRTGTELYHDTVLRMNGHPTNKDPNLKTHFVDVNNVSELLDELNKINDETEASDLLPYIHIESHGSRGGLYLASDEDVSWTEIIPIVRSINKNSGNNLFISVAACLGSDIQYQIKITEPAPFRGFLAPLKELTPTEVLSSFTLFFEELLGTRDFDKAIIWMERNNPDIPFHHMNCEALFESLVAKHVLDFKSPDIDPSIKGSLIKILWDSGDFQQSFSTEQMFFNFAQQHIDVLISSLKCLRDVFLHQQK